MSGIAEPKDEHNDNSARAELNLAADPWQVESAESSSGRGEIAYTMFPNQFGQTLRRHTATLAELANSIRETRAKDKGGLPFIKLAVFGELPSEKGCYRHDANVGAISGVEGDYDSGLIDGALITFDQAVATLRHAKVRGLLYTTPSSTDAEPHWRAFCPTSTQLTPEERTALMDRLNGIFGGGFAGESWTLSQSYYFGSVEGRAPVRVEIVDGDYIDECVELPSIPKAAGSTTREAPEFVRTGPAYSVKELRAMASAAEIACAGLHYDQLRVVVLGVLRLNVPDDEDGAKREEAAKAIWDANTASQSLTDEKFDDLVSRAGDLRYNDKGRVVGPGAFIHYAELGGWKPTRPSTDPNDTFATYLDGRDDGGPITLNTDALDDTHVGGAWVSYSGETAEPPPVAEIIPKWAEKHIMTYDEGGGGVGKSYVAEQESACIAAGHPVLGEQVERCDAFYLNYEEPAAEFERRLHRIKQALGDHYIDGITQYEWYQARSRGLWPNERQEFRTIDTSRLHTRHLREQSGAHLLRVTPQGKIIVTRFGRTFLDMLARRADQGQHSYVVFDGLMDAIIFEGGTRSDDSIARQVIAQLDRWCVEHDFTGRAIIHPSRTGERTGTSSYAPAWTTKPRALQTWKRVTFDGKPATDHIPAEHVFTRRYVEKRSHGERGYHVDLQCQRGLWVPLGKGVSGAEDPVAVATAIAIAQDEIGGRIKTDGTIGKESLKLTNTHSTIAQYRHRTGGKHGVDHFLGSLKAALADGHLAYQDGGSRKPAGYMKPEGLQF